jgi:hypothetical protein
MIYIFIQEVTYLTAYLRGYMVSTYIIFKKVPYRFPKWMGILHSHQLIHKFSSIRCYHYFFSF